MSAAAVAGEFAPEPAADVVAQQQVAQADVAETIGRKPLVCGMAMSDPPPAAAVSEPP